MVIETTTTKNSKFVPSEYQKNIFDFIINNNENGLISAVAGSGKTTTLIKSLEIIPDDKSILFMAFNKSISEEIKKRVPTYKMVDVKTVHSHGFKILESNIDIMIENNKYRHIYNDVINFISGKDDKALKKYNFDKEHLDYVFLIKKFMDGKDPYNTLIRNNIIKLVNLGRLHFIDVETFSVGLSELKLISKLNSILDVDYECEIGWYFIKLGVYHRNIVDYTDMIFLPNIFKFSGPKYDFVFIDECQDLNTCQRLLMLDAIKPETGRFIAVGDPKQSIYAFAGADSESYEKLRKLPNTKELPLSVTYRCGSDIIERVKHINPLINAHEKNGKGNILENFSYLDVEDGDMILCRNTYPVVSLCIKYLKMGRKAYIIGSDIGLSLITMIRKNENKCDVFDMVNVLSLLNKEKEKMIEKIVNKNGISKAEASGEKSIMLFKEKIEIIDALSEKETDPNVVIDKINRLFSDDLKSGICLSNIHKSKGLESNRVFILHRELMPSKHALLQWEREQEQNLIYVAFTRAKETLGFIGDYDAFGNKTTNVNIKSLKESQHVGTVNSKVFLELKIVNLRTIPTVYGETFIYDMIDENDNKLYKFGNINKRFFKNQSEVDKVGSTVSFYGIIKEHSYFKNEKVTKIGKIFSH